MAQQLLIGNEKASVFRGKLNDNYTELYGRMTYFYGWGYQDFDAGVISGTSVTITANSNGTGFTFDAANLTITNSAAIVRVADIDTVPYTGTTTLFSSKVKATAQTGVSVTLSGVPHASWGACRIYYYYKYDKVPTGYTAAPGFISAQKLDALDTSFVTDDVYNAGIANFVSTDNIFTIDYSLIATDGTTGRKIRQGLATTNSDGDINIPTGRTYKINNLPILNSNLVSGSAGTLGYLFTGSGTTTAPSWTAPLTAIGSSLTTGYIPKVGASKLENSLIQENATGIGIGGASNDKLDIYGALRISSNSTFISGAGPRMYRDASLGFVLQGYAGTTTNFTLVSPTGSRLMDNPSGSNNITFISMNQLLGIGTSDLDGTPPVGKLTVKGSTNDGTTNILVGRDSDEVNVVRIDTDGNAIFNGYQESAKVKQTIEGGIAIKLTNKTGANSVKGTVVYVDPAVDNAFEINPIDGDMPIGVVYESGIADGSECWVVVSGIAEVLLVNTVASTRSYVAYSSASVAGRIDIAASVPAAATHFREIGHTLESKVGGTNVLCKCILHFN